MRECWTISDIKGHDSQKALDEYNSKLLHPERPFGTAAKTWKKPKKVVSKRQK